jgi:hypothetical protein
LTLKKPENMSASTVAETRGGHGSSRRATLAQAAMVAIEPLVELLLEIGITSPEAESLLRSVFVHKARAWLTAQGHGKLASDARVALVTGVHRNFVRQILSEPPQVARGRERRGYLSGRVLQSWRTLAPYCNESGKPRDLPEKGPEPSFATLVASSLPAASPGVVLEELIRAGIVESLSDHRVRVRSGRARPRRRTLSAPTSTAAAATSARGADSSRRRPPRAPG